MIPRSEAPALDDLSEEFKRLDRVFKLLSELATGQPQDMRIGALSSSDWGVFLDSTATVALLVASAIERIIKGYKTILDIRKLHLEMERLEIRDDVREGLAEDTNSRMDKVIEETADDLVANHSSGDLAEGRINELRNGLIISLNYIANSIDHGFNFEIRVGPELDGDETDPHDDETRAEILERTETMQFISAPGHPILSLPIGDLATDIDEEE